MQGLALEAGDGDAGNGVACGGNPLHFHAALCANEANLRLRVAALDLLRDADRGEDVAACAATADD